MVGIAELFAEYSGEEVDWFQLAFCWERQHEHDLERARYNDWKRAIKPARRAYQAAWQRAYFQRRREQDPTWRKRPARKQPQAPRVSVDLLSKAKRRRDELRAAGLCINGPRLGATGTRGATHGEVVRGGKCQRCIDKHKRTA